MRHLFLFLLIFSVSILSAGDGFLGSIYPAGAQQGKKAELIISGQNLWSVSTAVITGGGITVEKVQKLPGFNFPYPTQRNYIVKSMKARKEGKPLPEKPENVADWRPNKFYDNIGSLTEFEFNYAIATFFAVRNSLQATPALNEKIMVILQVAPDAKPGKRSFRMAGNGGVSNALPFYIGTAPEVNEGVAEIPPKPREIKTFTVPAVLNGQILPGGETDRFLFQAKKDEVITFKVHAREFGPFLGDCVPGHFQPIAEIFDKNNRSVAFADYHYFHADPVLSFKVPADGEYAFTIRDAIYRGRTDFVYRVEVLRGEIPFTLQPFPPLPEDMRSLTAGEAMDTVTEENVRISGVITEPGEKHSFRFKAEKGKKKILEVLARRYGSPLDSTLIVTDCKGKILAKNDDPVYPRIGTIHHKADSYIAFDPPEDGIYTVTLLQTDGLGGKDYQYALRIDRERPNFEVLISPSCLNLPWGGSRIYPVYVYPKEGFRGDIKLKIQGTKNIQITGTDLIPANCAKSHISLGVASYKGNPAIPLKIIAESGTIRKEVIPGDEAMQAFAYTHYIPQEEFCAAKRWQVAGDGKFVWQGKLLSPGKMVPVTPAKKAKTAAISSNNQKKPSANQKKPSANQKKPSEKKPSVQKQKPDAVSSATPKSSAAPAVKKKDKTQTVTAKKSETKKAQKKNVQKKPAPKKVPMRWQNAVYETVRKVVIKPGETVVINMKADLSQKNMTFTLIAEEPPKGFSIEKTEIIRKPKTPWAIVKVSLHADKAMKPCVFNQVFKARMEVTGKPDSKGVCKKTVSMPPLPVLRIEIR